jgi:hypothetical protein
MPKQQGQSGADSLVSAVVTSPADPLLRKAIMDALRMLPCRRAAFLAIRLREIQTFMEQRPAERPWTFSEFAGTDGSRIFRGGVGHSLVVDPQGTLWRARSYEDFVTVHNITDKRCTIAALTPIYRDMRRCTLDEAR